MTDDLKPDSVLGDQRTHMLQVEEFLNNSESNYAVEDENGFTQGNSSENVYDTSLLENDILMLDEEVSQYFNVEIFWLSRHTPPLIEWYLAFIVYGILLFSVDGDFCFF